MNDKPWIEQIREAAGTRSAVASNRRRRSHRDRTSLPSWRRFWESAAVAAHRTLSIRRRQLDRLHPATPTPPSYSSRRRRRRGNVHRVRWCRGSRCRRRCLPYSDEDCSTPILRRARPPYLPPPVYSAISVCYSGRFVKQEHNGNAGEPSGNWCLGPSNGDACGSPQVPLTGKFWDCMCKILQSGSFFATLNTLTMGTAFPRVSLDMTQAGLL